MNAVGKIRAISLSCYVLVGSSTFADAPYGLASALLVPKLAGEPAPPRLSQTRAFKDTRKLMPSEALLPYDLNVPFWSDGAAKSRWLSIPNDPSTPRQKIHFSPTGAWTFPIGTVFVKHFDLATNEAQPSQTRRLETRLLICDSTGGVFGLTYKWRPDNSDADLLATNLTEEIPIETASGARTQTWYYPSREDCRLCHTALSGGVLGVNTRQLNRHFAYPSGVTDNQLRAWNHLGLLAPPPDETTIRSLPKLARSDDSTRTTQDRARSWLDANCSQCHRPGGTVASFDARYDTPLAQQGLIDGPILIDEGIDNARVIAPKDIWRSILFLRVNSLEAFKMPPLAHNVIDRNSIELLQEWINSLPGRDVLAPPRISPCGGNYPQPIEVYLSPSDDERVGVRGLEIHYTLDGSAPSKSDPLYTKPIKLTGPTILRARAFKPQFTKSITVQEVFIIGE
jgi:uncharacterized repeat protein (TIGR03806 family)